MTESTQITAAGLRDLREELEHLEGTRRQEIAERIRTARSFGDLKENSEYHDAKNEQSFLETVRYRTVGDMTCTGAVRSLASTADDVVTETAASRITERGATRADDRFSETAMEDRKREGYF